MSKTETDLTRFRQAAESLQGRLSPEAVPLERYTQELWNQIEARLPGFGPPWLRTLTMEYRLGGAGFRYPLDKRNYIGLCIIPRPSFALWFVYRETAVEEMFRYGYVPFADAKSYNFWMFRDDGNVDPEVLFLEMAAWNGDTPRENNGIIPSHLTLSQFLNFGASWTDTETSP